MEEKVAALAQLFRQAGMAHHEAFKATDGDDPAWPAWYADYLLDKLPQHLGQTLGKEQLAETLIRLDKEVKSGAGNGDWAVYYAQSLLNQAS